MLNQQKSYSGHKPKDSYKYQAIVTPDGLVSSLMGPFIGLYGNWKMVESSGLEKKLREVNGGRRPALALYLYSLDPAFCSVYGIMGPYKNYPGRLRTAAQNQFNEIMSKLKIEIENGFAIHQNIWTWNAYHLGLKVSQGGAICYAVSVLFSNIWTCLRRGNQTSLRFACSPPVLEDYLMLPEDGGEEEEEEEESSSESDRPRESSVESGATMYY